MKNNRLLLPLFGLSLLLNIIFLIFKPFNQTELIPTNIDDSDFTITNQTEALTGDLLALAEDFNDAKENTLDSESSLSVNEKIAILMKQNTIFKKQITAASDTQIEIVTALATIADKIDSLFLLPQSSATEYQESDFNLNFNSISRDVINRCMKLTSESASVVRKQQRQSRAEKLVAEDLDIIWSNEIESQVQSVFADNFIQDSELVSINCRTTICEVKVHYSSVSAKKLFEAPFFSIFQQDVSQYDEKYDQASKQSTGIFYLTRNTKN